MNREEITFKEYKFLSLSGYEKEVLLERSTVNHLKLLMADYYLNVTERLGLLEDKGNSFYNSNNSNNGNSNST